MDRIKGVVLKRYRVGRRNSLVKGRVNSPVTVFTEAVPPSNPPLTGVISTIQPVGQINGAVVS